MKFLSVFALLAAVAAAAPSSLNEAGPDPSKVFVRSVTYGGSGCPQGSVSQSFNADRTSFTLIFDKYVASVGPGVPILEARKNCQLNINLSIPQGWSYSIATVDYRGFVQLPRGMSAEQKSIYYFQGEVAQVSAGTRFFGPVSKDYLARDVIPINTIVWSSCQVVRPINANTQVRIDKGANTQEQGAITTDSIDGKVRQILGFQWRRC